MILIDGKEFKIPVKDHPWSKEQLIKDLPEVFDKKDGFIGFKFDPRLTRKGVVKGKMVDQPPVGRNLSTKTRIVNPKTEVLCNVVVTNKYERDANGDYVDRQRFITLNVGGAKTKKDLEELWYLWFISSEVTNNKNPHTDQSARVSFHRIEEEAKQSNNTLLEVSKLQSLVLDPERMSLEDLRKVGLVMMIDGSKDMDEIMLRQRFASEISAPKTGQKFRAEFNQAYKRQDTGSAQVVAMIQNAIDSEIIKRAQGKWVLVGGEGEEDEKIIGLSPADQDKKGTLVQFVLSDDEWRERIEDKMSN